jgi:hypothetical protein
MKKYLLILSVAFLALQSSSDGDWAPPYYEYYPVFMNRSNLDKSVSYIDEGQALQNTGKIYYKYPYLYVNERYKGVHVIDNSNPANPVNRGFIAVPGCLDMAVKDNIMYLDNSVDLVSFNLDTHEVTKRLKSVFPEPLSPEGYSGSYTRPGDEYVVVEWIKTK